MIRLIGLSLLCALATGCVQRTITVTSEPSGALVYLNDEEVGRTPTTVPFTWYGVYDVRLTKAGYETLYTTQQAEPPLFDTLGLDLISEVSPDTERVNLEWHYVLQRPQPVDESMTVDRARQLRSMLDREAGIQRPQPAQDEPTQIDASDE